MLDGRKREIYFQSSSAFPLFHQLFLMKLKPRCLSATPNPPIYHIDYLNFAESGVGQLFLYGGMVLSVGMCSVQAQTAYTYSNTLTSTAWTTAANWSGGTTGKFPGNGVGIIANEGASTDVASFGAVTSEAATIASSAKSVGETGS